MNGNVIEIIIRALDEASEPIRRFKAAFTELQQLNREAGRSYSDAQLAAAAFAQTIGTDSVNAINRAGVAMRQAIVAVKAFIAAWVFNKLVRNIAEAQEAAGQLDAAYRSTGDTLGATREQLDKYAGEVSRVTTYSTNEVKAAMAALLQHERVRGQVYQRTIMAAADVAARTGRDIRSTTQMIGRALQDPTRGLYMLTRATITFTAEERKAIQALQEQGDILGAQTMILDIIDRKFGGAAKTLRDTLGGAIKGVTNAFGDLFEGTKEGTQPAIDALNHLAEVLSDPKTKEAMDLLIAGMATLVSKFIELAANIPPAIEQLGKFFAAGKLFGFNAATEYGPQDLATESGQLSALIDAYRSRLNRNLDALASDAALVLLRAKRGKFKQSLAEFRQFLEDENSYLDAQIQQWQERRRGLEFELPDYGKGGEGETEFGTGTIEQISGLTDEQIRALQKIATAAQSAVNTVLSEVEKTTIAVQQNLEALSAFQSQIAGLSNSALTQLGLTREEVERTTEAFERLKTLAPVMPYLPDLRAGASVMAQLGTETEKAQRAIDAQIAALAQYVQVLGILTPEMRQLIATIYGLDAGTVEAAVERIQELMQERELIPVKKPIEDAKRAIEELKTPIEKVNDKYRQMQENLRTYLRALQAQAGDPAEIARVEEALARVPAAWAKALEDAKRSTDIWLAFQKRAAERLQDAWSDAFMQIGKGWKRFGDSITAAMRQILAEALSLKLMQVLQVDKFIEEGLDKLFEVLGVGGSKTREARKPKEKAEGDVEGAVRKGVEGALSDVPDPCECIPMMVSAINGAADRVVAAIYACCDKEGMAPVARAIDYQVVEGIVGASEETTGAIEDTQPVIRGAARGTSEAVTQSGGTLVDTVRTTSGALGRIFGTVGKELGGVFVLVGNKLASLLAGLRKQQSSSDWLGVALEVVKGFFSYGGSSGGGGMAGGGTVPWNKSGINATLVGEEGPELALLPSGTKILNARQLAYNGIGGGGNAVLFQPNYTITIENASDARRTRDQLEAYLVRRDNQLMDRVSWMLKDNGIGRMR